MLLSISTSTINLKAVEWTEGTLLPEFKAIVKTVAQIMEQVEQDKRSKTSPTTSPPSTPITAAHISSNLNDQTIIAENSITDSTKLYPNFTAANYGDSGMVPPDAMGVIGPEQFILAANGRIRSFDKKTGIMDHALDITTDHFFYPVSGGMLTSDSRIRYDRFSDRWVILITALIDPIRIVLATSDSGVVTSETKWSLFYFEPRPEYTPDYPTLGIDNQALYIGLNIMGGKNGYLTSDGFVIPKKPLLEGTLRAFAFHDLVDPFPAPLTGPTSPEGVDNFDADAREGYFIGMTGNQASLMLRRVKDPGGHPAISPNIVIPLPRSNEPIRVPQKGSISSDRFFLQGFDKRLGNTHIRDKHLYTAHNIAVNNVGLTDPSPASRDGSIWYEIDLKDPDHPIIVQTGVLFQHSKTNSLEHRHFWTPGIMTNGLHTLMITCSTSGNRVFADAAFALRFSNDPLGTIRNPHLFTKSNVVYMLGQPPFKSLRWGEYSTTSVDPLDNMTFWGIAEFSLASTSWGLQVVRVPAPPPAKILHISPPVIKENQKGVQVTISGERIDGSAFYDPGEGFKNRLKVDMENVEISAIKWISPTQIDLIISTGNVMPASQNSLKITNPDGQIIESKGLFKIGS